MSDSQSAPTVASSFLVSVLMERRTVSGNPWIDESWKAVGVTVGATQNEVEGGPVMVVDGADATQFLWSGFKVELFRDEAESYYHNLMVGTPGCYVVARTRDDGMPEPVLVTLSFDAGQAYLEGGETVYNVPLPPELYRATEDFVLAYYVPQKKKKRKLENWKEQTHGGR